MTNVLSNYPNKPLSYIKTPPVCLPVALLHLYNKEAGCPTAPYILVHSVDFEYKVILLEVHGPLKS